MGLPLSTIPPKAAANRATKIGAPMSSSSTGSTTINRTVMAYTSSWASSRALPWPASVSSPTERDHDASQHHQRHHAESNRQEGLRQPARCIQRVAALVHGLQQRNQPKARERHHREN